MRTRSFLAAVPVLAAMASVASAADTPAITIRPVQLISQAEVPEGAPDEAKSVMFTKGVTIGYLVEGHDLIGFARDSLVIDTMATADGTSIAKKRNGERNWRMGSFPCASDDGRFAFFQVQTDDHLFGHAEGLRIGGTITVRTGSEQTTATTKAHGLASKETEKIGDFDVAFGPTAGGALNFGGRGAPPVTILVTGPLAKIIKVSLLVDGKALDSQGSMGVTGGDSRTYQFAKPAGADGTVSISYWKNLSETPVRFGDAAAGAAPAAKP
jgi:hypothetical protein